MSKKSRKLIESIKEGDKLLFSNGKSKLPPLVNVYEVVRPKVDIKIDEIHNHTEISILSSIDKNQIGVNRILDFAAYEETYPNVFYSRKTSRDKKGNITWVSSGRIEILNP